MPMKSARSSRVSLCEARIPKESGRSSGEALQRGQRTGGARLTDQVEAMIKRRIENYQRGRAGQRLSATSRVNKSVPFIHNP